MEVNFIQAAFLYFFNGLTLEFGDEFFCMAYDFFGYSSQGACRKALLSIIYVGAERYTYISIISAVLGYALSPTFFIYVAIKGKPNTAGQIFSTILMVELIEGSISVLGQLATDGDFGTAIISLPLSLAVGSIRAIVLSFLFEWNRSDFFKFQVVALLCFVFSIVLYASGSGNWLQRSEIGGSYPQSSPHFPTSTQNTRPATIAKPAPVTETPKPRIVARRGVCFANEASTQVSIKVKFFDPATSRSRWRYLDPGRTTAFFVDYPRNDSGTSRLAIRFGIPKPGFGPMERSLHARSYIGQDSCSKVNTYTFKDKGRGVELYR
ncbi:hypothetical protein [Phaeobacter inhibens]|uniref:hypothetical protein n=1 Tax=Phaeobacter inhibens TaxID=221822 RepID=UPI0024B85396|nr:hypothetical protein [Phaeobacter inhibens]WHP69401.1 hypothetical protein QMZ01_04225 [Phaeobacter inhibens]